MQVEITSYLICLINSMPQNIIYRASKSYLYITFLELLGYAHILISLQNMYHWSYNINCDDM